MKTKEETVINVSDLSTEELLKQIQSRGYYIAKTPLENSGSTIKVDLKRWKGRLYRFGVVSDTHLGSRHQALTSLHEFYKLRSRRGIQTVFHAGDLVDGFGIYRGQEFETFVHGADEQRDYAIGHYPKVRGIKTRVIAGNHDLSFVTTAGYNIVKEVCEKRDDMEYIGDYLTFVELDTIKIALMHGHGSVAYARSYKIQKVVEQLSSSNKPHFLFLGHFHHNVIVPGYRNVEAVQMSCFQYQTPFEATRGLNPVIAGLIVEVQTDDLGLAKVKYEWVPFYNVKKNDF